MFYNRFHNNLDKSYLPFMTILITTVASCAAISRSHVVSVEENAVCILCYSTEACTGEENDPE
jgi:hypothetical protein